LKSPEHLIECAIPFIPGFIQPTRRSMKQAEKGLMTVTVMETRRNKENKKK